MCCHLANSNEVVRSLYKHVNVIEFRSFFHSSGARCANEDQISDQLSLVHR